MRSLNSLPPLYNNIGLVTNTVIADNAVAKVLYGMQIAYDNALQPDIQASTLSLATYPDNLRLFAVADSNGDGGSDFLWQDRSTNEVVLWTRDGATIKSKTVVSSPAAGFAAVAAYDIEADGSAADILLVNPATATLRVVTMGDAVASSTTDLIMPSGVWRPVPFPFIANSVLIRHPQTGELRRITMPGRGVASRTLAVGSPPANYEIQAIGDLDADGQSDIVASSREDDQVRFYLMNGNTISQVCTGLFTAHWDVQGMYDWDGNGVNDLVVSESGGDRRVVVLYMEVKTYANGSISIPQIKSNQVLGRLAVGEVVGLGIR